MMTTQKRGFTMTNDERATRNERLADAHPRFPLPACDIETGRENTVTARIVLDEIQAEFGVCQALVTIEGRPEEWSIVSIKAPADAHAFARYAAAKSPRYFREDWYEIDEHGSRLERELWRAVKATITEDMATEALVAEMGE